jgi:flavin-dependent thymidylate synthase
VTVTLIDYTGAGSLDPARYAANILIYTKSTRLKMDPGLILHIESWPYPKIIEELKLIANTNPGSWEFIYFTFLIEGVSRAFTHQLVRTRTASYAQQTMRTVDMENWTYEIGPSIVKDENISQHYIYTMKEIALSYKHLIELGAEIEDARGVLPTNIHTNINMSINMRNWVNLVRKRDSVRVQNEYHKVIDAMIIEVERVYPWIHIFIKNDEMKARKDLQDMIWDNKNLTLEEKTNMIKKLDIMMKDL